MLELTEQRSASAEPVGDTSHSILLSGSPSRTQAEEELVVLVLQEGKPLVLPSVKKAEQKVVNDPNANKVFSIAMHGQHTLCL